MRISDWSSDVCSSDLEDLRLRSNELREQVGTRRVELTEARARHESMRREAEARSRRLAVIIEERRAWDLRSTNAERQIETLEARQAEGLEELQQLESVPAQIEERRIVLLEHVASAEAARGAAADALATAEARRTECARLAKTLQAHLGEARQEIGRASVRE